MSAIEPTAEFESFVEADLGRLLRFGYALTANPHDAWDLVQEALVRVSLRWPRAEIADPSAYARRTMVRLNVDRLRRLQRELLTNRVPERSRDDPFLADGLEPWLVEALQQLTPTQRTILAMRYLNDQGIEEIAQELNCSAVTVRSHLSRGLDRIRSNTTEGRRA